MLACYLTRGGHLIIFQYILLTDKSLPAVALPVGEGRENLWGKTREAYRYVWENYKDQAEWFMKADDDTYEQIDISVKHTNILFFFFLFFLINFPLCFFCEFSLHAVNV